MDIKKYRTEIKLHITPVWHKEPPVCIIRFAKDIFFQEEIKETKVYSYEEYLTEGGHDVIIEFLNKKNTDTVEGKDKAIKIEKIVFNNIESEKFAWQGVYTPIYPQPWLSQQKIAGQEPMPILNSCTYIGWNGVWKLTYSVPIFTWIHKVEDHGWIYD